MSNWDESLPQGVGQLPGMSAQQPDMLAKIQEFLKMKGLGVAGGASGGGNSTAPMTMARPVVGNPNLGGSAGTALPKGPGMGQAPPMPGAPQQFGGVPVHSQKQANRQGIMDFVQGAAGAVERKKQENQHKQYIQAENTWSQLLEAQKNLQDNPQDPQAKLQIDEILSDKKRMKMVEESLGIMMPQDKSQEQTPTSVGAQSAIKKFGAKLKSVIDPRTQAQQMQGGGPGSQPMPNTPGGIHFGMPQQNAMQQEMARRLSQPGAVSALADQQQNAEAVKSGQKISTKDQAIIDEKKQHDAALMEESRNRHIETLKRLDTQQQDNHIRAQAEMVKAKAYAHKMQGGGAGGGPSPVDGIYAKQVMEGSRAISSVPKAHQDAVTQLIGDNPIIKKFSSAQQAQWDSLPVGERMLNDFQTKLAAYMQKHPRNMDDKGLTGVVNKTSAWATSKKYAHGMKVDDPELSQLIKDAGYLRVNGAKAFTSIGRNRLVYSDIVKHLPDISDTPAAWQDKADWLGKQVIEPTKETLTNYRYSGKLPSTAPKPQEDTNPPQASPQGPQLQPGEIDGTQYLPKEQ